MKDSKYIKSLIELFTALIWLSLVLLLLALLGHALTRLGVLQNWIDTSRLSLDLQGIQVFPKQATPVWQLIFPIVSTGISIGLLINIRRFLIHLKEDAIFSSQNVTIVSQTWKLLVLLSLFSGNVQSKGTPLEPPFSLDFSLNASLLLAAIIVWLLGKILERGIEIAQENELTI